MSLSTDLFDYHLPAHLIAQVPAERRDHSHLLVVDRASHRLSHHRFADLPQFLRSGDTLFRNNAAVLPARLFGQRPTGGKVECFLLQPGASPEVWRCLIRPGKKLPVGATFQGEARSFVGRIEERHEDGTALVRFETPGAETIVGVANRIGEVPLPPYINRDAASPAGSQRQHDVERYQTVYANTAKQVAVAAPTAGLHFTPELLRELTEQGIRPVDLTLHVGLGTFKPIATDTVEAHAIHRELYEISATAQQALFPPLAGRRIAVGTTSVRTIEDFLGKHDSPLGHDCVDEAGLFIYPPRPFRGVDALITNFHQPRSTLLCLVSAFLAPGSDPPCSRA